MTMGITSPTSTTGQILKDGTPVISFDANNNATFAGTVVSNTPLGMRNRIINGDMVIDQRRAGASVTITTDSTYTLDRWMCEVSQASKFSVQQDAAAVTPPAGFNDYLGVTSLSSYSVGTSDYFTVMQRIEGYNVADLDFGKATAKTITISFWVRSSLTGTFGGSIGNSAENRSYPFSYTISAANTWEQKTITIAGDTTGTWLVTNGRGLNVRFSLGMGSTFTDTANAWTTKANVYSATGATSVVGTNGATFYITGVQLERGSTATSFEWLPYGTELALCQRYALMIRNGTTSIDRFGLGSTVNSTTVQLLIQHPVALRAAPTLTTTGTAADYQVYSTAVTACNAAPTLGEGSQFNSRYNFVTAGGLTGGQISQCSGANTNAYLLLSAEL